MTINLLPTGNYSILCLAALICIIYFTAAYFALKSDLKELRQIKVVFFQENIAKSNTVYSVSFTIKEQICKVGTSDLIFRIRGSLKDAPLILYRDESGKLFKRGSMVNIGVALPFNVGNCLEIDIACNNDCCEETDPVIIISDIYVRQYPRWTVSNAKSKISTYSLWKQRASTAIFSSLAEDLRTWVCMDTITNTAGAGIVGIGDDVKGTNHVLRTRDAVVTLPLTRENPGLKKHAKMGYRPLHYLYSLSSKWHDPWSNFSKLDHVFVLLLDQLAGMVAVSMSFAFAFEENLGLPGIRSSLQKSYQNTQFTEITQFDLYEFFTQFGKATFDTQLLCLVHIAWMSFLCSLVVIPLSLLWCRLFRLIGGKGFEKILGRNRDITWKDLNPKFTIPITSTGPVTSSWNPGLDPIGSSLMLRTLECRSVHAGSCVTSNRRLRVEPMICNCLPDYFTARSVAYVRTKMARLRNEDIPSGPSGLKSPKILHESHTQSTDAPIMPQPTTSIDGSGEVVRVARFCERLVQQAPQSILDNSVIAECFEVAPGGPDPGNKWKKSCCPRQCCKRGLKCCQESFSSSTFFTEEDAVSVKEMVSNFSLRKQHRKPNNEGLAEYDDFQDAMSEMERRGLRDYDDVCLAVESETENIPRRNIEDSYEDVCAVAVDTPAPSGHHGRKHSSNKHLEVIIEEQKAHKEAKSHFSLKSHSDDDSSYEREKGDESKGVVWIGRKPTNKSNMETGIVWKQVRQLKESTKSRKESRRRCEEFSAKATPFPSSMPSRHREKYRSSRRSKQSRRRQDFNEEKIEIPERCCLAPDQKGSHSNLARFRYQQIIKLRKKLLAFILLTLFQLGEIVLVTVIPGEGNNQFYVRSLTDNEITAGSGRMHAAVLSCVLVLLIYYTFTIHVIALLSSMVDQGVHMMKQDSGDFNMYNEDDGYAQM